MFNNISAEKPVKKLYVSKVLVVEGLRVHCCGGAASSVGELYSKSKLVITRNLELIFYVHYKVYTSFVLPRAMNSIIFVKDII